MLPIQARGVFIKKEAAEDPRSMARIERMMPFVHCQDSPKIIDDDGLAELIAAEDLNRLPRHGRDGENVEPVVLFNQYLYHHSPEEQTRRREKYPEFFHGYLQRYGGYGGFDWRPSGDANYRRETGLVCQPAWAIHSYWGCHFRCAYCSLGHVAQVYVNLEDWIEHIREGLAQAGEQRLFQWDNGTDVVCWEPECGATKLLVDLFAEQDEKYLELYVGKSDHVDFLLDFDHKGRTVCCWSLGCESQCRLIEPRTASMEERLTSARKCQEAGYTVRIRLSPMAPMANWRAEIPHMIRRMFEEITPDMITMEPLRFHTHEQLLANYEPGVLDPEFVDAMERIPADAENWARQEFPDEHRLEIYRVALAEIARLSPQTPVALCREKRRIWDALSAEFGRMGQDPDDYVCNCGPRSAGCDRRLLNAVR